MDANDKLEYSGKTSSYHHKWNDTPNPEGEESGLRKVWFLDAQWSDCPIEVEEQVKDMWRFWDCGNDKYIIKTSVEDLLETIESYEGDGPYMRKLVDGEWTDKHVLKVDYVIQYIRSYGIADDERVIIHWWW